MIKVVEIECKDYGMSLEEEMYYQELERVTRPYVRDIKELIKIIKENQEINEEIKNIIEKIEKNLDNSRLYI